MGGWVSLVWGNLAQSAYPSPWGGGVWVGGWLEEWPDSLCFSMRTQYSLREWRLKVAKFSGLQAAGIKPTLCMFVNAVIYR